MRKFHWNLYCFIVVGLASVLTEEVTLANDLKSIEEPKDNEKEEPRSGIATNIESDNDVTKLDSEASRRTNEEDDTSEESRMAFPGFFKDKKLLNNFKSAPKVKLYDQLSQLDQNVPHENEYKHNPINANQVLTYYGGTDTGNSSPNQPLVSGAQNLNIQSQRSGNEEVPINSGIPEPYSRAIPHNERIRLHDVPGANYLVSCSSEGELHNVWTYEYQCLVCVCIREGGLLRPVCASCSGCTAPNNNVIREYTTPWRPDEPVTTPAIPFEDEVTCKPLPVGQPFENPLHPCQVCVCTESITAYGKPDVNIQCEENPQCVLPADATVIPIIPDVPVPSPYCEKFPVNVFFPHPMDACKTCRCTEQLTHGVLDKLLICSPNPDCGSEVEIITEVPIYPIPISAEPIYEIDTIKPWTPATAPPPHPLPPGPLPGPSPHDSCQPYIPNQAFQHPWDECQMCVCTEAFAKSLITVEISCFTKKSCCIEPPYEVVIPATLPPAQYKQSGKLHFQDAICEYKTFGVEFAHPKDPCDICTCELQGLFITLLCKRSSKPECQLLPAFPTVPIFPTVPATLPDIIQGIPNIPSNSISLYNTGSVSSPQNTPIKNQFISNQNLYGTGQGTGLSDQWNHQKYQRPGGYGLNSQNGNNMYRQNARSDNLYGQNSERLGGSKSYEPQYNVQGLGYSNQGYNGAYGQNYYPAAGQYNAYPQGYPGNQPGLRSKEYTSQSQATASATSAASAAAQSNSYGYTGYPYLGYPGGPMAPGGNAVQYAHSSASAQSQAQSSGHASAQSSARVQMRSGNPDEEKPAEKED